MEKSWKSVIAVACAGLLVYTSQLALNHLKKCDEPPFANAVAGSVLAVILVTPLVVERKISLVLLPIFLYAAGLSLGHMIYVAQGIKYNDETGKKKAKKSIAISAVLGVIFLILVVLLVLWDMKKT